MEFNCLVPELRVSDINKSKAFYIEMLGFAVAYEREDFAMMVLDKCQIMLQQLSLPSKVGSWNVSEDMCYPFGRGINLQIILPDIAKVYYLLKRKKQKIFIDLLVSDYKENEINNHVLEFLVQDPDGYLLRFQQDIEDWSFGDNKEQANELFNLVIGGQKTATSYIYDGKQTQSGFSILTNYDKTKRVILLTKKAEVKKFKDVTEKFAFKEGEKDKSLENWKKEHRSFFTKRLLTKGKTFSDNLEIVCEEFEIVKLLDI